MGLPVLDGEGNQVWPPTLAELKVDLGINDTREDTELNQSLQAAISYVEFVKNGFYVFSPDEEEDIPLPPWNIKLGTIRLAGRWHWRRKTPDGMLRLQDLAGPNRVPQVDMDIQQQLRIGRWSPPIVA